MPEDGRHDGNRWQRIDELFQATLDLPAGDRSAFLDDACDDPDVRAEVEELLEAADSAESFMESRTRVEDALDEAMSSGDGSGTGEDVEVREGPDRVGEEIGPWRVVARLGRGGMATVYRAQRTRGGFEQEVALKVIRRGLDTEDVVRRFHGEREILAGLRHPGIAGLLDGGATDDGLPWLAMELVNGAHVTRYADDHRLTVPERLRLFLQIADVVAYAHRNLVVHRDLKPSNILVTEEGKPVLLDFGIAKLLSDDADGDGLTRTGARWITPGYGAPEQILGTPVTTATDVFQLGVLLFELLTGRRPFPVRGRSRLEVEKAICQEDPPRPSAVVTRRTGEVDAGDTAAARRSDEPSLRRMLEGDLDAIVRKALRKEPEERYASAEAMARDVRRHLDAEPVEATRGGTTYRVRKFVRRNPGTVSTAVLFLLLLVGYAVTVTWQAERIAEERDRAELEAGKRARVTDFLTGIFQEADPRQAQGEQPTVLEALQDGVARIGEELSGEPEIQAELYSTTGDIYKQIGDLEAADSLMQRAVELNRQVAGDGPTEELFLAQQASAMVWFEQARFDEALARIDSAADGLALLAPEGSRERASALTDRAEILRVMRRHEEAEAQFLEAIAMYEALDPVPSFDLGITENNLALIYHAQGRLGDASRYYTSAVEAVTDSVGPLHPYSLIMNYNLAALHRTLGQYAVSDSIFALVVEGELQVAPLNPNSAASMANHAMTLQLSGRLEESEALYREALAGLEPLGSSHPAVTLRLVNLGEVLVDRGLPDSALAVTGEAGRRAASRNDEGVVPGWIRLARADILGEAGRGDEAIPVVREVLDARRAEYEPPHGSIASALDELSIAYEAADSLERAVQVLEETVAMWGELEGRETSLGRSLVARARLLALLGRLDEGEAALARADSAYAGNLPPGTIHAAEADAVRVRIAMARLAVAEGPQGGGDAYRDEARAALADLAAYVDRNLTGERELRLEYLELRDAVAAEEPAGSP